MNGIEAFDAVHHAIKKTMLVISKIANQCQTGSKKSPR
jgi:hypothetical protein